MKKQSSATDIPLVPMSSLKQAVGAVLRVTKKESDAQIAEFQGMNALRRAKKKNGK